MNLEIKNGNFSYTDGNPILKDINLKIESGEIFTILGQNGIGKTTLLKCINGVLKWNSGEVFIDNRKVDSIKDLKVGAKIAIPSDSTNEGRALILLHNNGIIKLKDPKNLLATPVDIVSNPKKLKFQELDAALLPRTLDSVDGAIITANYALQAGFVPSKDAILLEDKNSPYVNVLVTRKKNQNNEDIKKLAKALNSEKAKKFIIEKYKGAVVPAF